MHSGGYSLGLGGSVSRGATLEREGMAWERKCQLWERECQLPEPQETWHCDAVRSAVGGQPLSSTKPCSPAPSLACPVAHLPRRSPAPSPELPVLDGRKLEGEGRLQSAWRAQRLSHQMTTGDSEPARICIHFASHLHRICSLPSPHPSIILLRGWGGGGGLSPGPLNGE